ncbi:SAM-dependent methyltransferase [Micromonospora sp. WMMD1076]|nr:SAM-dependent methyltransferase [Micromonospora sp. WMMD1076]WFF08024.1 SAM-dependent methyltransferase [Micromonospora sp. WMMD1076]
MTEAANRPDVARMYDYYLGGCHNFAAGPPRRS